MATRKRRSDALYIDDKARLAAHNERLAKQRKEAATEPHEFIAVDGEGVTIDGQHYYVMLSVGDETLTNNGDPIGFESIAEFLWQQYTIYPNHVFVGFFLTYDFTMWLKGLPYDRAKMLYRPEDIARRERKKGQNAPPFPVRYGEWEFDLLNDKRFKLRPVDSGGNWLWVCDAGPFFQSSFLSAIDPESWRTPVVSDAEFELIKAGKNNRSAAVFGPVMERYNIMENEILSRVMREYDLGLLHMGIRLRRNQYFGPGQVAGAWLKSIGAPTRELAEKIIPRDILEAGRKSYYGGWFEIMVHGHIPGPTYEYDINSAYPTVIKDLPCFECGSWQKVNPVTVLSSEIISHQNTLVFATVEQDKGNTAPIGAMPHRTKDGAILRPRKTCGWYWMHEIAASSKAGLIDCITIHDGWHYSTSCSHKPFAAIADLYTDRLAIGKDTPTGKALKLVYNSAYGKLAQSIGNPTYANPLYASLVTAGCRTMILEAIATHPTGLRDVTMVATDGVYFRTEHPTLDIGENLGQWGIAVKSNLTQHQPGLYWDDTARQTDNPKFKSRGISASDMREAIPELDYQWRKMHEWIAGGNHIFDPAKVGKFQTAEWSFWDKLKAPMGARSNKLMRQETLEFYNFYRTRWPRVDIPLKFALIGARTAMHRNKWSLAGTLDPGAVRKISSTPKDKRNIDSAFIDVDIIRTMPYTQSAQLITTPYSNEFGIKLRNKLLEQNDVFTADGTFNDEIYEILRGE